MAIKHAVVAVGTSATTLMAIPDARGYNDAARSISVQNNSGQDVFLGGPGVTTTVYGHKLATGATYSADLDVSDLLYAVAASAVNVNVNHFGV